MLRLIADGASNATISSTLVISPKTVSVHVSHILAKLGVSPWRGRRVGAPRRPRPRRTRSPREIGAAVRKIGSPSDSRGSASGPLSVMSTRPPPAPGRDPHVLDHSNPGRRGPPEPRAAAAHRPTQRRRAAPAWSPAPTTSRSSGGPWSATGARSSRAGRVSRTDRIMWSRSSPRGCLGWHPWPGEHVARRPGPAGLGPRPGGEPGPARRRWSRRRGPGGPPRGVRPRLRGGRLRRQRLRRAARRTVRDRGGQGGRRAGDHRGRRDVRAGEDPDRPFNTLVVRGAAEATYRKIHLYDSFGYRESDRLTRRAGRAGGGRGRRASPSA